MTQIDTDQRSTLTPLAATAAQKQIPISNNLNQIERAGGAGKTLVEGTVDEPAIVEVSINSGSFERAVVFNNPGETNYRFRREVDVNTGLNTIDVRAEDDNWSRRGY